MYLTPDTFLSKYEEDGKPFFKIYQGATVNEKKIMKQFLSSEHSDQDDRITQGKQILDGFFNLYPDGGKVTIVTTNSKNTDERYNIFSTLKWGNGGVSSSIGNTHNGMMNMQQQFSFFQQMMAPQIQMMEKLSELTINLKLEQMQREAAEQGEAMSVKEAAMMELIGTIKPIGEAVGNYISGKIIQTPQLPAAQKTPTVASAKPTPKSAQPKIEVVKIDPENLNFILSEVGRLCEAYAEYDANVLMKCFALLVKANKQMIAAQLESKIKEANPSEEINNYPTSASSIGRIIFDVEQILSVFPSYDQILLIHCFANIAIENKAALVPNLQQMINK